MNIYNVLIQGITKVGPFMSAVPCKNIDIAFKEYNKRLLNIIHDYGFTKKSCPSDVFEYEDYAHIEDEYGNYTIISIASTELKIQ